MTLEETINAAVKTLREGGVILYPTDTVWGLGCDATNAKAVERLSKIKHRNPSKPMLILTDSDVMVSRYVSEVPDIAYGLMDVATDPLTIVYDSGKDVAPALLGDDGSIGIRVTDNDFCRRVIHKLNRPVVSTSANISGAPLPEEIEDVSPEICDAVDFIADFDGRARHPEVSPSHIIKVMNGGVVKILR